MSSGPSSTEVKRWPYQALREALNTSTDVALLKACREEFHRRMRVYRDWKLKNNPRRETEREEQREISANFEVRHWGGQLQDEFTGAQLSAPAAVATAPPLQPHDTGEFPIYILSEFLQTTSHPVPAPTTTAARTSTTEWPSHFSRPSVSSLVASMENGIIGPGASLAANQNHDNRVLRRDTFQAQHPTQTSCVNNTPTAWGWTNTEEPVPQSNVQTREEEGPTNSIKKPTDEVEMATCQICMDAPVQVAFVPCRHFAVCRPCCDKLRKTSNECPYCRGQIVDVFEPILL